MRARAKSDWVNKEAAGNGCVTRVISRKSRCIIHALYSIGSNNKFDFESALLENVSKNCEIHVFDHTVSTLRLVSKQRKPRRVHFRQIGLAATTSRDEGGVFKSLDIVRDLGHVGRTINILKVDCEGCEWTTFAVRRANEDKPNFSRGTRAR